MHKRLAAKKLIDTTMNSLLFFLLLLISTTGARYMSGGAIETQANIMHMDGNSLNTDLYFDYNYVLPTTYFDYSIYRLYPRTGSLTMQW